MQVRRLIDIDSFSKYSHYLILLYCFSASLSIAASQIATVLLILYLIVFAYFNQNKIKFSKTSIKFFSIPVIFWILTACISSVLGINHLRALDELSKTSLYMLLPVATYISLQTVADRESLHTYRIRIYLLTLICSQVLASVHTIITTGFGNALPFGPPGSVTEAGQLVLVLSAAAAMMFMSNGEVLEKDRVKYHLTLKRATFSALILLALLMISWPELVLANFSERTQKYVQFSCLFFGFISVTPLLLSASKRWKNQPALLRRVGSIEFHELIRIAGIFLVAALVINLKRGPWLAIFVELLILGYLFSRRLFFLTIGLTAFAILLLSPVRTRTFEAADHYSIMGGRQAMWSLGLELAQRYPLGLGLDNAKYMRVVDPSLPEEHTHMHNNLLNIAVETGWIGLGCYLWWMFSIIGLGILIWKKKKSCDSTINKEGAFTALMLSIGLLGWQVAGLVEYNFGDGEVRLIALFFMGLIIALADRVNFAK